MMLMLMMMMINSFQLRKILKAEQMRVCAFRTLTFFMQLRVYRVRLLE